MTDKTQGDIRLYLCVKQAHLIHYELTCFNFILFDFMLYFTPLSNQSKSIFFHLYFQDLIKHTVLCRIRKPDGFNYILAQCLLMNDDDDAILCSIHDEYVT